ncbi:hypothetical protein IEO21_00360 [Rhodonia placenta]|uniref:GYF domain-containing protein n=1 Tax=Rhodonia placenta TaxID=104341 RepID=A0A8H7PBU9_9APHY|nr:hypothetical protein IEO21_00360 [Postia placenta]
MAPAPQPRLRIKLKLPAQGSSGGPQTAASTPAEEEEEEDEDEDEPEEPRRRRIAPRDDDVESEDSDDADDGAQSTRSTSVATTGTGARALTARQAVLANVVDSSHVSLDELPNPRKKKPLTEIEMALKREETARKRRNLTEKKLEDEKTETINRLLKKQSRAKGRRNALSTAEDRPTQQANADDMDDAADAEAPEPVAPTMFRWVSSSRVGTGQGDGKDDRTMALLEAKTPCRCRIAEKGAIVTALRRARLHVDEEVQVEVNSMVVPGAVVVLTMVSSDVCTTVTDPSAVVVAVTVTTEPDALTDPVVKREYDDAGSVNEEGTENTLLEGKVDAGYVEDNVEEYVSEYVSEPMSGVWSHARPTKDESVPAVFMKRLRPICVNELRKGYQAKNDDIDERVAGGYGKRIERKLPQAATTAEYCHTSQHLRKISTGNMAADDAKLSNAGASSSKTSLYEGSTQYRHWRFSPEQLAQTRASLNAASPGSASNVSFLNAEEENLLVKLYIGKISQLCGHFRFPEEVEATAMTYLKRFYLKNTVMDWHPKNVILAATWLRSKYPDTPEPPALTVVETISTLIVANGSPPDVEAVREVDRRLKLCKNPEKVVGSKAYAKKQDEAERKAEEKRRRKAAETRKAMEDGDPFGSESLHVLKGTVIVAGLSSDSIDLSLTASTHPPSLPFDQWSDAHGTMETDDERDEQDIQEASHPEDMPLGADKVATGNKTIEVGTPSSTTGGPQMNGHTSDGDAASVHSMPVVQVSSFPQHLPSTFTKYAAWTQPESYSIGVRIGRAERRAARRRARETRPEQSGDADGEGAGADDDIPVNVTVLTSSSPPPVGEDGPSNSSASSSLAPGQSVDATQPQGDASSLTGNSTEELLAVTAAQSSPYTTFQQLSFAPNFPLAAIADEYIIPPTYASFLEYRSSYEPEVNGDTNVDLSQVQFSPPGLPVPVPAPPSMWYYRDPKGNVHGPWKAAIMQAWYRDSLLPPDLPVKREEDSEYMVLKDLRAQCVDPTHPFRSAPPLPTPTPPIPAPDDYKPLLSPISLLSQPRHFGPPALFYSSRGGHSTTIVDARGRSVLKGRITWSADNEDSLLTTGRLGDVKRLEAFDVDDRAVLVAMRQGGLEVVDFGDALLRPADHSRTVYPHFQPPYSSVSRRGAFVWKIGTPLTSHSSMSSLHSVVDIPTSKSVSHRKKLSTGPAKSPRSDFTLSSDGDSDRMQDEVLFLGRKDNEIYICERRVGSFRILKLSPRDTST